jgi:hypothetical protein
MSIDWHVVPALGDRPQTYVNLSHITRIAVTGTGATRRAFVWVAGHRGPIELDSPATIALLAHIDDDIAHGPH